MVEGEAGELVSQEGGPMVAAGRVMTREQAFEGLSRVADFFEQTEPHSPVSFALRQVIRWGRMSLPELLTELISDESVRSEMFRRAGIPHPNDSDS